MPSSNERVPLGTEEPIVDARLQDGGWEGHIDGLVERARRKAHEVGLREARTELSAIVQRAVETLDGHVRESEAAIGRAAIELGLEIARHLLKAEVEAGSHDIESIVRETLQEARVGREACTVHLHPDDHARLVGLESATFRAGTRLQADDGVALGDVQVESSLGCIVRDIDRAVESIGERLRGELSE